MKFYMILVVLCDNFTFLCGFKLIGIRGMV